MGARIATVHRLATLLIAGAMVLGCGRRAADASSPRLAAEPPPPPRPAELLTLRVRAYADPEHQAHLQRWDAGIAEQVRRVSAILEAELGIRLEVESIRTWERAVTGSALESALQDLAALDPGLEVDWVVGFVGSLAHEPADPDAMGRAAPFGRHLVLRAVESPAELSTLGPAGGLAAEERRAIALERRQHRETATFLHAWAHSLGAVHDCDSRSFMAPRYSLLQSRVSPETARLVRVGVAHRTASRADGRRAWLAAYDAEVAWLGLAAASCGVLEKGLAAAREELAADPVARRRLAHDRYLGALVPSVVRQWRVPTAALRPDPAAPPPEPGTSELGTSVVIRLDREGGLAAVRVSRSSGIEQLDRSVVEAVEKAQPFAAPPPDLLGPDGELEFEARFHARR